MNGMRKTRLRRPWSHSRRSGGANRLSMRILPEPLEDRRLLAILTFEADPAVDVDVDVGVAQVCPENSVKLPPTTPDFNGDGLVDGRDIDALTGEIVAGTHTPSYDLTGDKIVDLDDRDAWLAAAAINLPSGNAYLLGDANLDGKVDVSDWNVLNSHMFTKVAGYCFGDFNADKVVDVSDLNILRESMFTRSDLPRRGCLHAPHDQSRSGDDGA